MKKIIIGVIFILAIIAMTVKRGVSTTIPSAISPSPVPQWKGIVVNEEKFAYSMIKIIDNSKISLIFNELKESSSEIVEKNDCLQGLSGGFYDKDYKPLGLLISEEKVIGNSIESSLFNGYLWVSDKEDIGVTREISKDNLRLGLQSGPILIENGQAIALKIKDDFPARRIVAGVTDEQKLIFMVIFNEEFKFQGPKLADLPKILKGIEKKEMIRLKSAINLDGGKASAFYTKDMSLLELSTVGSFFCLRE